MEKTFSTQLIEYKEKHSLTQKEMSAKLGISERMYAYYEKGDYDGNPSKVKKYLAKLASNFQPTEGTPIYEMSATAGEMENVSQMPDMPSFHVKVPGYEDCNFGMHVYGHSMYPTIETGSLILCRKVKNKSVIMYGEIYLIRTDDYLMVKRLQKNDQKGYVLCTSDNFEKRTEQYRRFEPFDISIDSIIDLYLVKGIIKANPDEFNWKMKIDRHAMRKEVLDAEEINKLAKAPCGNETVKRLFFFCCNTGLRFGDASGLTWNDIKGMRIKIEQGKTGRFILQDLNETAKRMVGNPGKDDEPVFDLKGIDGINAVIETWYKKAKLDKHITTHCARHTFCTNLMRNKTPSKTIISLMGWDEVSGMKQLMRYAHLVDETLKEAVDSLPEIEY